MIRSRYRNQCWRRSRTDWIVFQRGLHKGVLNRCGSVKIKGVTASGTIKQKQDLEYEDLTIKFQMLIYKFEPYEDPNHPRCSKGPKS